MSPETQPEPALRRVIQSLGARAAVLPFTALLTLTTTALVLDAATTRVFAVITVISTLSALLSFTDLGLGASVINLVASPATNESKLAGIGRVMRVLLIPALAVSVVGVLGAVCFSWSTALGLHVPNTDLANIVTAAVMTIFAASIPLGIGQRILTGLGRNHEQALLSSIGSVVALVFTALVWAVGWNPLLMAIATPLGAFSSAAACTALGLRRLGASFAALKARSPDEERLFTSGAPMLLVMIGLPLALGSHRLILSHRSVPTELAQYGLVMQFYSPVWSLISVSGMALWPIFARRRVTGGIRSWRLVTRMMLVFAAIGLGCGTCLAVLAPIVGAWVSGGKVTIDIQLSVAAGLLVVAQSLQQVPGMYLTDRAGLWYQAACIGILALAVVTGAWLFAPAWGAPAVLAVTALAVIVIQLIPGLGRVYLIERRRSVTRL